MASTPKKKALPLINSVLYLHHFLQSSILHKLGVVSKVTTLAIDSIFFFPYRLLDLQAVFRVFGENATVDVGYHYTNSSSLGMICTNVLMNLTERITNRATKNISGLPAYYLWYLGCIICHLIFGSPLCNVDSQQINILLSVLIYHCFHLF